MCKFDNLFLLIEYKTLSFCPSNKGGNLMQKLKTENNYA